MRQNCVLLLALSVLTSGCAEKRSESPARQRQELNSNDDLDGFILVPDSAKIPLSGEVPAASELKAGFRAASSLNSSWVTGVRALEVVRNESVIGTRFLVAPSGYDFDSEGVFAPNVQVVVLSTPLTVDVEWFATKLTLSYASAGAVGHQRCCGAETLCESSVPLPPVCGRAGTCGDVQFLPPSGAGLSGLQLQSGRSVVGLSFIQGSPAPTIKCLPKRDPACNAMSVACGFGAPNSLPETTQVAVPQSSACGVSSGSPYTPRAVPPYCEYAFASSQVAHADTQSGGRLNATPGDPPPDCEGRCFGCEANKSLLPQNQRPWQCTIARTVPGGGVCEDSPAKRLAQNTQWRLEAGIQPGATGKSCMEVASTSGDGRGQTICTTCDAQRCYRTALPAPWSPIASQGNGMPQSDPGPEAKKTPTKGTAASGVSGGSDTHNVATVAPAPATGVASVPPEKKKEASTPVNNASSKPASPADGNQAPATATVQTAPKSSGDPVNVVDGSFELTHVDMSLSGPTRSLNFIRSYSSRSSMRSELGENWTHNWDVRLV